MKNNTVTQISSAPSTQKANDLSQDRNAYQQAYKTVLGSTLSKDLIALTQPKSAQVEAFRMLRSQLMLRWFNDDHQTLAIVATTEGEGCSYVTANLAVLFAQLSLRTLLIDANLRAPTQQRIFNTKVGLGLSELLAGDANVEVTPHEGMVENLSILCAGTVPQNPLELLSRKSFAQLISQVKTHYDIILVDTAPAVATADAQAVVANCGGALLVSRLNHTKLANLTEVRNQISVTGAHIVGSVVNAF